MPLMYAGDRQRCISLTDTTLSSNPCFIDPRQTPSEAATQDLRRERRIERWTFLSRSTICVVLPQGTAGRAPSAKSRSFGIADRDSLAERHPGMPPAMTASTTLSATCHITSICCVEDVSEEGEQYNRHPRTDTALDEPES